MRPIKKADLSLFEHDDNEKLIGEVVRHPIGYFFIGFSAVFLILFFLVGLYFVISNQNLLVGSLNINNVPDISNLMTILVMGLTVLVILGSFLAAYVYGNNYLVLTDSKIVLVFTTSIIRRRVSQLSIGDVQDVTIAQDTIASRLFKYGSINIETAGEQANFSFPYAENPYACAKYIIDAHEQNLKLYGN